MLAAAALALASVSGSDPERFVTIRVLETTDVHGYMLPGARERGTRRPIGGSAALAAWIARLRAENPDGTILLDGGDWFQGTMISNLQFGRPIVDQMNRLGYDAAAIGNHEFDWGLDTLRRRIAELHCAVLGANCTDKATRRTASFARADTILSRGGVRIGVLGLCYRNTQNVTLESNVYSLIFEDDSATAVHLVPDLRRRGARIVIGLAHVPDETDRKGHAVSGDLNRLARGVPGVDVWLGGHSHNRIADTVAGVPVVIAGAHAECVGVVDLTFDRVLARVVRHREWLVPTYSDSLAPDSATAARVATWNAAIAPLAREPVGRLARRLTRGTPNLIGYLVTDAMRFAGRADIAMTNSGGLRADLDAGVITRGRIYELMPFDNTIVTLEMNEAELRAAFEEGLRSGRVLQVSGLQVTYEPGRVIDLRRENGAPLEPGRSYKVAINNFLATGGDGYRSFKNGRNVSDTNLPVRDAIETYVHAARAAIDYHDERRLVRVAGQQ